MQFMTKNISVDEISIGNNNMFISNTSHTSVAEHFSVYLFIRFAGISYGWFTAIHYKFKLLTYVQEPLVMGRRGYLQRFK